VWDIYERRPGLVLGFHGCDKTTGEATLMPKGGVLREAARANCCRRPSFYPWIFPSALMRFLDSLSSLHAHGTALAPCGMSINRAATMGRVAGDVRFDASLLEGDDEVPNVIAFTTANAATSIKSSPPRQCRLLPHVRWRRVRCAARV
jgi:hypothetical protein